MTLVTYFSAVIVKTISNEINHNSMEITMKFNVGGIDRALRILAGLALIAWAVTTGPVWAWAGVILLLTGIVRFCPVYPLLGISTCKTAE